MTPPGVADRLTELHVRVLELLAQGHTDRRIASELGVSESTVQRRIREASRVLGARSRVELAVRAVYHGVISPVPEDGP